LGGGELAGVDGDVEFLQEDGKTGDVVGVFVCKDDGVEGAGVFADGGQAGESFAGAEAAIDEDAGVGGADEGGVAGAAGGENGDLENRLAPETKPRKFECSRKGVGRAMW
jgi:hypothetical protein